MSKNENENRTRQTMIKLLQALCIVLALCMMTLVVYLRWERPPEIKEEAPVIVSAGSALSEKKTKPESTETETAAAVPTSGRKDGVYTILLVGNDDGNGNTDTMVVGLIDTENHTMDFVNLPRDLIINKDWDVRKLNASYASYEYGGESGIEGLKQQVRNIIGYTVDCYAMIDLSVFIETIDLMGGVYFDVPQYLFYEDPGQNLYIDIAPGYQLLNGYQAMGVCRFRSYLNGDLDRIGMQQKFLKAMATQFVTAGNIPNMTKVIDLLADNLKTDLDASNIAFFLRQALACKAEDINFHTVPCDYQTIHELSYAVLHLDSWLEMLNEEIDPFYEEITAENLDAVYLDENWCIRCTQYMNGSWYFY